MKCVDCGKEISRFSKRCKSCSNKAKEKKGKYVKCNWCGKLIYKIPYHLKKYKKHYCSFECNQKDRKGRGRKFTGKYVKCNWCGKLVYRRKCFLKRKHFFCSNKCCGKFQSQDKDFKNKISKGVKKAYKMGKIMGNPLSDEEIKKIKNLSIKGILIKEISKITGRSTRVCYERTENIRKEQREEDLKKFKEKVYNLNDYEVGYFLGILDGEGSLSIGEHTNTPTTPRFFPTLDITNSNKNIINFILKLIPFNYTTRIKKEHSRSKDIFVCRIYDRKKLAILLKFLKPYKWEKKKQAKVILNFLKEKEDDKRKGYCNQIRKLNKRGK